MVGSQRSRVGSGERGTRKLQSVRDLGNSTEEKAVTSSGHPLRLVMPAGPRRLSVDRGRPSRPRGHHAGRHLALAAQQPHPSAGGW